MKNSKKILLPILLLIMFAVFCISYYLIDINRISVDVNFSQTDENINVEYTINNASNHSICVESNDLMTNQYKYLSLDDECISIIEKNTIVKFNEIYVAKSKSDYSEIKNSKMKFKIHYAVPDKIYSNYKVVEVIPKDDW